VQGPERGWGDPGIVASLAAAVLLLVAFVALERRSPDPLMPLELFANRNLSVGTAITFMALAMLGAMLYFLTIYFQEVHGYDALETGLAFLPQPLLFMAAAPIAGRMIVRGPRLPLALGAGISVAGALALLAVDGDSSYGVLMVGLALNGLGGGLAIPAVTSGVMGSAPPALAGIASATLNAGRQIGGVLGVAVLGGIAAGGGGVEVAGMHQAVVIAALGLAVASALSLRLREPRPAVARQAALATD
jgi:predicted MFS family arabinose efflux permease